MYDKFSETFEKHLPTSPTRNEAFFKATEELGFDAYADYKSFNAVRSRKHKINKSRFSSR